MKDKNVYIECGCCGHYHKAGFIGDCRENKNRWSRSELEDMGVSDEYIVEYEERA